MRPRSASGEPETFDFDPRLHSKFAPQPARQLALRHLPGTRQQIARAPAWKSIAGSLFVMRQAQAFCHTWVTALKSCALRLTITVFCAAGVPFRLKYMQPPPVSTYPAEQDAETSANVP